MGEVIAVVLGVAFLHVFFRAVESQWPASYFALTSGPDYAITRSLARYLAFRLLPVFVVAVFSAVTLARADRSVVIPVLAIGGLHALLTSGRALLGIVRSGRLGRRPLLGFLHPVVMAAVIGTAVAGSLSATAFESIVPGLDEVTSALWTGLVAGVIGAYAVRVTQSGFVDTAVVFSESRRTIPNDLWDLAADLSAQHDADVTLVRAVMLTENIQRPRWFRRLEKLGARTFRKRASLGLLQTPGDPGDSDADLLARAIEERFAGVRIKGDDGYVDWPAVEAFARSYNSDSKYVDLLSAAAQEVASLDRGD